MDAARLRAAFPVLARTAYLNAGTCGPLSEAASRAAGEAWRVAVLEGRSGAFYERLMPLREQLRERYAALLGARVEDVALTSGTSEGVGRVVGGLGLREGDEIVTADDEHPGLLGPLVAARERLGVRVRAVPLADVADAVGADTRLVACSHVSWSSGSVAPVDALRTVDVPVLLDGAQGAGAVPVSVEALGCQFYAASGQKWCCGPVGLGMLWVDRTWRDGVAVAAPGYVNLEDASAGLDARLAADARRFDALTHDLPAVAAALAGFDVLAEAGWDEVHGRAVALAAQLATALRERGADVVARDQTTLVAWDAGPDYEQLPASLAEQGVVVRALPGTGRLRASVGAWNDEDDLARLLAALPG